MKRAAKPIRHEKEENKAMAGIKGGIDKKELSCND